MNLVCDNLQILMNFVIQTWAALQISALSFPANKNEMEMCEYCISSVTR